MSESSTVALDLLPHNIKSDIVDYLPGKPGIACPTINEAFDAWLHYNGIIGYGPTIRNVLYHLITASHDHLTSTDQADTDRLKSFLLGE